VKAYDGIVDSYSTLEQYNGFGLLCQVDFSVGSEAETNADAKQLGII
jgi:hypothetical protein